MPTVSKFGKVEINLGSLKKPKGITAGHSRTSSQMSFASKVKDDKKVVFNLGEEKKLKKGKKSSKKNTKDSLKPSSKATSKVTSPTMKKGTKIGSKSINLVKSPKVKKSDTFDVVQI